MAIPVKAGYDAVMRRVRNFGNLAKNIASGDGSLTGTKIPFFDDEGFLSRNMPITVLETKDDLPDPVDGVITLESGVYWIVALINLGFDTIFIPDDSEINIQAFGSVGFLYLGTGVMFTGNNFNTLFFKNGIYIAPNGTMFDFQPATNTLGLVGFEIVNLINVSDIGNFKNLDLLNIANNGAIDIGQGYKITDVNKVFIAEQNVFDWKNETSTMFTFKGAFQNIRFNSVTPVPQSNESVVFFEPTMTANNVSVSTCLFDDSSSGKFFQEGITGDIFLILDGGGGLLNVAAFDHGLTTGDKIEIRNTEDYNGGFEITRINANAFSIIAPFVTQESRGDFDTGSLKQDFLSSSYKANTRVADSVDFGSNFMITNSTATIITTQDVPVKVAGTWIPEKVERFIGNDTGRLLHTGLNEVELEVMSTFRALVATGANVDFAFYFVIGNDINNVITAFADNGAGGTTVTSVAHGLSNGDRVPMTNTTSYDGTHTIFSVTDDTFDIPVTFVADDATGNWALVIENSKMPERLDSSDRRSIVLIQVSAFFENDYLEVFVENNSNTANITLDSARIIIA